MPTKPWSELTEEEKRAEVEGIAKSDKTTVLLFYRMLDAIKREFGTWDDEYIFKDHDQQVVLRAIVLLTESLVLPAACARGDYGYGTDWEKLTEGIIAELRQRLRENKRSNVVPFRR